MVQQRAPLHLLLRQRQIGERIRAGGDEQRRGRAPDVPRNLRQRVHVLERAPEHGRLQAPRGERAGVVERDGRRGEDGVEGRDLLAHEVVFGLGGERGVVGGEVGVPPPPALDVRRRGRDGGAGGGGVDDGGDDGGGEGKAGRGRVEVQDGGLALWGIAEWWLGSILARDHWSVRARRVGFQDSRTRSLTRRRNFTRSTRARFHDPRLWRLRKSGRGRYGATRFLWNTVSERHREYNSSTDRLHCRSDDRRNLRVRNRVVYVLHLAHRMCRVVMDSRLEGLKVSMVRTVVRWVACNLGGKLGAVRVLCVLCVLRLPARKISCMSTIITHFRNMVVGKGEEVLCRDSLGAHGADDVSVR